MTFHIFFFTTMLQKHTLSETEINRKQQLKQLTLKVHTTLKCIKNIF
ncbi:hypothetical protein IKA_02593 [Bacillus cereus VD169]|nr:hypothetical protein IKA_02593 [Bacillus cereus VD169]